MVVASSANKGKNKQPAQEEEVIVEQPALAHPKRSLQHLFLQALISRRTMEQGAAAAVYRHCVKLCGVEDPEPDFLTWLLGLEPSLSQCGLEIKRGRADGREIIALVNAMSDDTSKLATEYKPEAIAFFRLVVEKIMTTRDMAYCCSMTEAIRLSSNAAITPALTKLAAQGILKSLIAKGWLDVTPTRYLTLSDRSRLELQVYLRETFDDDEDELPHSRSHVECIQCLTLVTSGWACPNGHCSIRVHRDCTNSILTVRGQCPGTDELECKTVWPDSKGIPVGLGVLANRGAQGDPESEEDELATQPARKAAPKKSKKAVKDEEEDELEDGDDSEVDDAPVVKKARNSRKSTAKVVADDDEDDDMYE